MHSLFCRYTLEIRKVHDEVVIALVDLVLTNVLTLVSFLLNARLAYLDVKCLPDSLMVNCSAAMVICVHHEDLTYPRHLVSAIHGARILRPNFLLALDVMARVDCSKENNLRLLLGSPY